MFEKTSRNRSPIGFHRSLSNEVSGGLEDSMSEVCICMFVYVAICNDQIKLFEHKHGTWSTDMDVPNTLHCLSKFKD